MALVAAALLWLNATGALAQALSPEDALSRLTARDLTEALLALNNLATAPGLAEANLSVTGLPDGYKRKYDRLSVQMPSVIGTKIDWLKVHLDLGIGSLRAEDAFPALSSASEPFFVDLERSITSGRIGIGPGFEPFEGLYFTPYFAASYSGIDLKANIQPPDFDFPELTPEEEVLLRDWSAQAWTVSGVFDLSYLRWLGQRRHRADFHLRYVLAYSETLNESLPILQASGTTHTLSGEAIFRRITQFRILGRNLAWNVFTTAGGFPGQKVGDLGFTYTFGFGAGLDLYFPDEMFGVFDRRFFGIRGSGLVGDNNSGWSIVVEMRK